MIFYHTILATLEIEPRLSAQSVKFKCGIRVSSTCVLEWSKWFIVDPILTLRMKDNLTVEL